jgi:hypothetical protein
MENPCDARWRGDAVAPSLFLLMLAEAESRSGSSRCVDPVLIDVRVDLSRLDTNSGSKTCKAYSSVRRVALPVERENRMGV